MQLLVAGLEGVEKREVVLDLDSNGAFYLEDLPSGAATLSVMIVLDTEAIRQETAHLDLAHNTQMETPWNFP